MHVGCLQGLTRSPVFNFVASSAEGVSTIRARKLCDRFHAEMIDKLDWSNRAAFLFLAVRDGRAPPSLPLARCRNLVARPPPP